MANAEEIASWDGPAGEHWVRERDRYDAMLRPFGERLLAALGLQPGERVLEVGCGTGALAVDMAALVGAHGLVTAVDVSSVMLDEARQRAAAAGVEVDWRRADAQVDPLGADYDAVTSRFGVMFFDDPAAAFANLAGALRPGGRLAVLVWQDLLHNEWITVPAGAAMAHVALPPLGERGAPGPFAMADPARLRRLLAGAGFEAVEFEDVRAPARMGADVDDVVGFYRRTELASELIERAPPDAAAAAWEAVRAALASHAGPGGVILQGAAWLVTARRPGVSG